MAEKLEHELIKYLAEAHAMERQALELLDKAADAVGDEALAEMYRSHRRETAEHEEHVRARLAAHGHQPQKLKDAAMQAGGFALGMALQVSPDTPIRLATSTFAFENLEIAAYQLIERLARLVGDYETVAVIERILEQEEAAAERIAGTFGRMLELALGVHAGA